jgi:Zn finger protein HypA/HybF involved in hydrogenase expression
MVGEAFAGLSAIKTAFDIAKGLKDIDDATRRNAAVIELQEKILAAREAQSALLNRVGELEEEVDRFETWDAEKLRYQLKELASGSFAYVLKPEAQGTEPPHQICAACYERRKKSILQRVPNNSARMALGIGTSYRCPECKSEVGI